MIFVLVSFVACVDEPETSNTDNCKQNHYEIDLTLDNFSEYIKYTATYNKFTNYEDYHELTGVLAFAYYKDVVCTFFVEYTNHDTNTVYNGTYKVKLDASGCYSFYSNDAKLLEAIHYTSYQKYQTSPRNVTLTNVTGKVIFTL